MGRDRKLIYVNANAQTHEIYYTGIEFYEFVKYLSVPIHNLLLLKAHYIGNNFDKNFELVEGQEQIELLTQEDVHGYGDFCFVDYAHADNMSKLTDAQIAELLYLAHMKQPLRTPFFDSLNNNFVYLAHDDGWCCKLYCRNMQNFSNVLTGKIKNAISKLSLQNMDSSTKKGLMNIAENGMLIDFDDVVFAQTHAVIDIFSIGKFTDMDIICNQSKALKSKALHHNQLKCNGKEWTLV